MLVFIRYEILTWYVVSRCYSRQNKVPNSVPLYGCKMVVVVFFTIVFILMFRIKQKTPFTETVLKKTG